MSNIAKDFVRYIRPRDYGSILAGFVAAKALQPDAVVGKRQQRALRYIKKYADTHFMPTEFDAKTMTQVGKLYNSNAYWHGTGRHQWGNDGQIVDVLAQILKQGTINPYVDKYDPSQGAKAAVTISLALNRVYARCYADMHQLQTEKLNRYIDALHITSFYVTRPYLRHRYLQAKAHPKGLLAGQKAQVKADAARFNQVGRHWSDKIRKDHVNPMVAFRVRTDISDNYGILFGIASGIKSSQTHKAFVETREVRAIDPITLDHITHIEVPVAWTEETQQLLKQYDYKIPVLPIEAFEMYASLQPIEQIFGVLK